MADQKLIYCSATPASAFESEMRLGFFRDVSHRNAVGTLLVAASEVGLPLFKAGLAVSDLDVSNDGGGGRSVDVTVRPVFDGTVAGPHRRESVSLHE
jgi:hypothetical protein